MLVVLVAFPVCNLPDADPDVDLDADADIVDPDCEPEAEPLGEADRLAEVLEALSSVLFWFCRRTRKASILLSKASGHGQAAERVVKKRRRAAKAGKRAEPFMSKGVLRGAAAQWDRL